MLLRILFLGTLLTAGVLGLALLVAPLLASNAEAVRLFAADAVVRRTALACALGLTATAFVFFRPVPGGPRKPRPETTRNSPIAGA